VSDISAQTGKYTQGSRKRDFYDGEKNAVKLL
jgi:hypothetical protein